AHVEDLPPDTAAAPTAAELKQNLVDFARKLGFDSCRVAACAPPTHADECNDWLSAGAHGEMEYMARGEEKRRDPQKILPGAKSVIVLALNYFQGNAGETPAAPEDPLRGKIARYAWGDDYHELVETKLRKIDNFLHEFGGE